MDGQSGIFFQPTADVVPSRAHRLGAPTMSFHLVDAGPVAGDYLNVGVEEGFSNRLEFGFTRNNHTDGGDPAISPLFNFAGMNIFNVKAKLLPAGAHKLKYVPSVSVGGVLRTDDPFVVQSVQHQNATNGGIFTAWQRSCLLSGRSLRSWPTLCSRYQRAKIRLRREHPQLGGACLWRSWFSDSNQEGNCGCANR